MLLTLALLATSPATVQQSQRRVSPDAVPVRYTEGSLHGFVELRTVTGALLAQGDLIQVASAGSVESRLVFHFTDSSTFEETVSFGQHDVLRMQHYHLVQRGPVFNDDIDASLSSDGQYVVVSKSHRDGKIKRYAGTVALPPDISNGMAIIVAKNLVAGETQTVHIVAFTPEPRLIGLELVPSPSPPVMLGRHAEAAVHYTLKPKLGALLRAFATVLGKAPPDSDVWIVTDDVPVFVRFVGPMYTGPVWRLTLASPTTPPL